jgi:alpha-ketoglutarate-dependent taurine dioxygenase
MSTQVKEFTDLELKNEVNTLLQDGFTFHYEQNLSKDELVKFCRRIGNTDDDTAGWYSYNPKDNPDISRVMPGGLFGGTELHWHSNGTVHHLGEFKEILIALYCKEECIDTVFSLLNNRDAFLELSESEKDYWRSIEIQLNNFGHGIYGTEEEALDDPSLDDYIEMESHKDDERMSAVNTHPVGGEEFLYWQPPLIEKAWQDGKPTDVKFVREKYKKALERSIYQKHFVFKKGDLLIMDQLYTVHRRSHIVNKTRELWRVAFDYTTIIK